MKRTLPFLLLGMCTLACIQGCNWRGERRDEPQLDSLQQSGIDSLQMTNTQSLMIWDLQFDTLRKVSVPIRLREVSADTLNPEKLVQLLNRAWPEVQIEFEKISGDTVHVRIPNSTTLTQGMGTAGAEQYLATTTFTWTELSGIHYVHYEFEPGDHAMPGVYSRKTWLDAENLEVELP